MQSKMLLATLLAIVASADNFMAHPNMKRDIEARATATATGILSDECQSAILDVYSDVPTPPAAIVSDLLENPQTDPCSLHTPASLSKEYASYSSEVVSWYDDNKDALSSALSECPALSSYATGINVCETGSGSGSGSGSDATATGTSGSDSASSTSESNSDTTGAASHQSGMAMAAVAVAGFVVAIL